MRNPDDYQSKRGGRNDSLCHVLEWQEVNEGLKSNDIKLGLRHREEFFKSVCSQSILSILKLNTVILLKKNDLK